jgi:hypothetical protein
VGPPRGARLSIMYSGNNCVPGALEVLKPEAFRDRDTKTIFFKGVTDDFGSAKNLKVLFRPGQLLGFSFSLVKFCEDGGLSTMLELVQDSSLDAEFIFLATMPGTTSKHAFAVRATPGVPPMILDCARTHEVRFTKANCKTFSKIVSVYSVSYKAPKRPVDLLKLKKVCDDAKARAIEVEKKRAAKQLKRALDRKESSGRPHKKQKQ